MIRKEKNIITRLPVFLLVLILFSVSCGKEKAEPEISEPPVELSLPDTLEPEPEKEPRMLITYQLDSLESRAEIDSLRNLLSENDINIIHALNRIDAYRVRPGGKLLIPDTLTGNLMDYAPFPEELEILDSIPKTVLISQRVQAFALYEKKNLVYWGPVSSGKQSTPTPNGLHYGNYRAKRKVSTVNPDWLLPYYFNFMNFEGVGVHQYSMPGFPASHACVRLRMEDAVYIYNWAEQWQLNHNEQVVEKNGTPFMVFGEYDFENSVPWFHLAEDPESNFLSVTELDTLKNYVSAYFKDERNFKEVEPETSSLPQLPENGLETIQ